MTFNDQYVRQFLYQVSIAVSRPLFGDMDFNGTIFVNDDKDDDWVIHFLINQSFSNKFKLQSTQNALIRIVFHEF